MSLPKPKMGVPAFIRLTVEDPTTLCQECDPAPGWGWRMNKDRWSAKTGDKPPTGKELGVLGVCNTCRGDGVKK